MTIFWRNSPETRLSPPGIRHSHIILWMVAKTSVSRSHWAPFPATAQLSIFPVGIFGVRLSNPSALMARTYLRGIPRKPYQTLMQSGTNLTLSVGKCRRGTSLPLTFAPYTRRRVILLRWVGDDAVFVKRRGPPSPAFPDLLYEDGAPFTGPEFPIIYPNA